MHDHRMPCFTLQYDLTEDIARQAAVDLWEFRLLRLKTKHPEWGTIRPLVLLFAAAAQIVIAMGALVWLGDWNAVTQILMVAGCIVIGIILWKASFYALPFLGRWLACSQSLRQMRKLDHLRIQWRLYEDRLETESAATQRKITWAEVKQMSLVGQSVLLSLNQGMELIMPSSVLTERAREFIEERIQHEETMESND